MAFILFIKRSVKCCKSLNAKKTKTKILTHIHTHTKTKTFIGVAFFYFDYVFFVLLLGDDSGKVVIWNMAPIRDEKEEADINVPRILCQMDSHLGKDFESEGLEDSNTNSNKYYY